MEEKIRHFCDLLLERLEEEFSDRATDVHISLDGVRGALAASDDEGELFVQRQLEELIGIVPAEAHALAKGVFKTYFEERREQLENLPILKPFDIVFEVMGEDNEENILTVDSDMIFLDSEIMEGLSDDLDSFWQSLSVD